MGGNYNFTKKHLNAVTWFGQLETVEMETGNGKWKQKMEKVKA